MADVQAIFGTLLALGIAFPGMLTTWWLLFPRHIAKAGIRLESNPWRCLGVGALGMIPVLLIVSFLSALPLGLAKFLGGLLGIGALAFSSLGAAGLAQLMANRSSPSGAPAEMTLWTYLKAAIVLELAAVFPIIGWFFTIPAAVTASFGASLLAILKWEPKTAGVIVPEAVPSKA